MHLFNNVSLMYTILFPWKLGPDNVSDAAKGTIVGSAIRAAEDCSCCFTVKYTRKGLFLMTL